MKALRPYTIYCSDDEFELTALLAAVAAGGGIVKDKKWIEVAIPYSARLNKLIIKFKKDVQQKNPGGSAANIL